MKKEISAKFAFIDSHRLFEIVQNLLDKIEDAKTGVDATIKRNSVDVFSALFDSMTQGVSLSKWFEQEISIKSQKTWQNSMGLFHQDVLGSFHGWKDLGTGNVVDIVNHERKIIAEIKNKHNTTKGNHKTAIYKDFRKLLHAEYKGYTAYYVEVIPKPGKRYDRCFTPSDNRTKRRLRKRSDIRMIDGYSFYDLAGQEKDVLPRIYKELPGIIGFLLQKSPSYIEEDSLFMKLFNGVYQHEE